MNTYADPAGVTRPLRVCLCRGCDAVLAHPHPDHAYCRRCAEEVAALAPREGAPAADGVPLTPGFAAVCALAVCVGWLVGRRLGALLS